MVNAIKAKNLRLLQYLNEEVESARFSSRALLQVARIDNVQILKYIVEEIDFEGAISREGSAKKRRNYAHYAKEAIELAALLGNVEVLKFMHENVAFPAQCNEMCLYFAVRDGHLNCLQYIDEHVPYVKVTKKTLQVAIYGNHLQCIKYIHDSNANNIKLTLKDLERAKQLNNSNVMHFINKNILNNENNNNNNDEL